MSLSVQQVLTMLKENRGSIDNLIDLGFILTVLRDNAGSDEVFHILKEFTESF